eukprot:909526-Rhodomonas_salina.4
MQRTPTEKARERRGGPRARRNQSEGVREREKNEEEEEQASEERCEEERGRITRRYPSISIFPFHPPTSSSFVGVMSTREGATLDSISCVKTFTNENVRHHAVCVRVAFSCRVEHTHCGEKTRRTDTSSAM